MYIGSFGNLGTTRQYTCKATGTIIETNQIYSPKHTLQKLCKHDKLFGSFNVFEHNEHVRRSLSSLTGTLSETFAICVYFLSNYIKIVSNTTDSRYSQTESIAKFPEIDILEINWKLKISNIDLNKSLK